MSKLNKGYYHELADRVHIEAMNIENNLISHPTITKHKKWRRKLEKAQDLLLQVYQRTGAKM